MLNLEHLLNMLFGETCLLDSQLRRVRRYESYVSDTDSVPAFATEHPIQRFQKDFNNFRSQEK